jgi:hypothetical protein
MRKTFRLLTIIALLTTAIIVGNNFIRSYSSANSLMSTMTTTGTSDDRPGLPFFKKSKSDNSRQNKTIVATFNGENIYQWEV